VTYQAMGPLQYWLFFWGLKGCHMPLWNNWFWHVLTVFVQK
jgi:hypothetical protein